MRLRGSTTVTVLGLVGVVLGAVGLLSLGPWVGGGALALVVVLACVGWWFEHAAYTDAPIRFKPTKVAELDALRCGVDETAPWLLEKTSARDGESLLSFVSRRAGRALSRDLVAAVAAERSVVVGLLGESKAGKTRCMFELVRARVPDALLFAPCGGPDAVRQVIRMRRFRSRHRWTVLWLDHLERFVDPRGGGVDDGLLDEVLALSRVVVVITAGKRLGIARLENAPTLTRLIPGDEDDGGRIAEILGQDLAGTIGDEGLGAACVGAAVLLDIQRDGMHPNFEAGHQVPEGMIVVECLIAAGQLGLGALTREQLLDVYRRTETAHGSLESFDRGLRWAVAPLHGEVALALSADDAYRAYEYIVENSEPVGRYRIRAEHALAALIDVEELISIADRARECYELPRALRLYELALTRITDRERQAQVITTTGLIQSDLGQFADAFASHQRALRILEAVCGPEGPQVAMTLANLGNVQGELGQLEAASDTLQRALGILEPIYGPVDPVVAKTLGNLAIVQAQRGELEAARASLLRALAIQESLHGADHPDIASVLTNLGNVQRHLGEFKAAQATQRRALAINESVYGPEHPEVAATLTNLGGVQMELGEFDAARVTQQRALAIQVSVYGPEHPDVATTLTNIGVAEQHLGELAAASLTLQRALEIKEAVYGLEHPEVARTLSNLGNVQRQVGQVAAAQETQQRALKIKESVYGSDHPEAALALTNLAMAQRQLGDPVAAEMNVRRALAIFEARLPADHALARSTRRQLAELVAARGEVPLNVSDDIRPAGPDNAAC